MRKQPPQAALVVSLLIFVVLVAGCAGSSSHTQVIVPTATVIPTATPVPNAHLTPEVNPFIGTAPGGVEGFAFASGDVFPGAVAPLGMLQWSPDTISNLPGGYSYLDNTIRGFSLTHFSGRGCQVYEDVPFMPR